MIKAVCFDLDGVYFTPESFKRFKQTLAPNVDDAKLGQVLNKSSEMLQFKTGKMSEDAFWQFACTALEIPFDKKKIFQTFHDVYEINPEVRDYVRKVRQDGFKTCICSNNFVTRIRELGNAFHFLEDFDVRVFSFEVGYMKPDIEIYKALVEKSGVKASEIVYSDDSEEKLAGAHELGIQAFVFENFEQFRVKLRELGVN